MLRQLQLVGCDLDAGGVAALAECILSASALTEVRLEACGIDAAGVLLLEDAFIRAPSSISSIALSDNRDLGDAGAAALARVIAARPSLTSLSVDGCGLTDAGKRALCAAFNKRRYLRGCSLVTGCVHFGKPDVVMIAEEHALHARTYNKYHEEI
jgi:Ran GTPase-activating protein (RanGAP) involved in mRNA processing and transport